MRDAYCSFQAEVVGQDTLKLGLREREGLYHPFLTAYDREWDLSDEEQSGDPAERVIGGPGIGGSLPTPPSIPKRRAAIGAIQELSE